MDNSIKAFILALPLTFSGLVRAAMMEDTVATVNGEAVMLSEYMKELNSVTDNWRRTAPNMLNQKDAMAQIKTKVLDQMIDNALLAQDAEKKKIKIHDRELDNGIKEVKERNFRHDESGKNLTDDEVDAALAAELKKGGLTQSQFRDRIRKQLMIRKIIDDEIRPKIKPPEEPEIKAAFEKIKLIVKGDTSTVAGMGEEQAQAYVALGERVRDLTSERVRVSHILIKTPTGASLVEKTQALKKAQDIKKRIDGGEDFAELARKNSEDAESAARGGDMGFLLKGWMPAEFEKVAFTTAVGEVSEPVETQFGYHVIRVQEKKASESISFEKLKDDLAQFLYNMKFQADLEKAVKALRAQAHIELNLPKEAKESKDAKDTKDKKNN